MELKEMTAGHLDAVERLSEQLGYPVDSEQTGERFSRLLNDNNRVVVVVNPRVVGWTHVALVDSLESEQFAEIRALVVDASVRRKGVGKMLVEEAKRWAREKGVKKLRVRSNVVREEAHKFYPAQGFSKSKTQAVYDFVLGE
jgi:GNAT superfamily N-acetyltransferase